MCVNPNIPALYSLDTLAANDVAMQKTIRRLSAGLRINATADDAARLAVSVKMRSHIRGLSQAARNAQDGVSMFQTAKGRCVYCKKYGGGVKCNQHTRRLREALQIP
jgi:flagellin